MNPDFLRNKASLFLLVFCCIRFTSAAAPSVFLSEDLPGPDLSNTRIDSLLESLTVRQKIGQMILVYHSPYEFLRDNAVGGVLIMANMLKNPDSLAAQLRFIQARLPVGLLVTIDQEGGKVNRLNAIRAWRNTPSAAELSALAPDSIAEYAARVARQLRALGININLAPVLDPALDWQGNQTFMAVRDRSFGNRAENILPPAKAFIRGFSDNHIMCVAKHFPGYDAATNSDHDIAESRADSLSVAGYLKPFQESADAVGGVLMSSIYFRNIDGGPSVLSPSLVGMARSIYGEKLIMTDDLWGTALRSHVLPGEEIRPISYPDSSFARLVELAFLAGNDVLMITFPKKVEIIHSAILKLVSNSPELAARLDASVRRILVTKDGLGLIRWKTESAPVSADIPSGISEGAPDSSRPITSP